MNKIFSYVFHASLGRLAWAVSFEHQGSSSIWVKLFQPTVQRPFFLPLLWRPLNCSIFGLNRMTAFSLDSQEKILFNPLYGTVLGLGCSLHYIKSEDPRGNVKPKKESSNESDNNSTLRAFEAVGAVVGIRPTTKMLQISRGFVNRMLVRYSQAVNTTTASFLFVEKKENETKIANY